MFKDNYIKDNEQIKPDEEFLARLKAAVAEEKKEIIVDSEKTTDYREINETAKDKKTVPFVAYKGKWIAMAACVALLFMAGFLGNNIKNYVNTNGGSLQGKSLIDKAEKTETEKTYMSFKAFIQKDVYIYEVKSFEETDIQNKVELSREDRETIISAILADKYNVVENKMQEDSAKYYVVIDAENNTYYFALGNEKEIYIQKKNTSNLG